MGRISKGLARSIETALGDGVVLGHEHKSDRVANFCLDAGRVVRELSVWADDNLMVVRLVIVLVLALWWLGQGVGLESGEGLGVILSWRVDGEDHTGLAVGHRGLLHAVDPDGAFVDDLKVEGLVAYSVNWDRNAEAP